jgi:hypothetical protein
LQLLAGARFLLPALILGALALFFFGNLSTDAIGKDADYYLRAIVVAPGHELILRTACQRL